LIAFGIHITDGKNILFPSAMFGNTDGRRKNAIDRTNALLPELRKFRKLLLKTTMPYKYGRFLVFLLAVLIVV